MRKLFLPTICIVFVFSWLAGCSQKDDQTVQITIDVPKYRNDTITVGTTNMLSMDGLVLAKVKLDSNGRGTIEFKLDQPVFASVRGPKMVAGLLLSPGDHFSIVPSSPGAKLAVSFTGDGAAVQKYLFEVYDIRQKMDTWNGVYSFRLDSTEFIKARDSLSRSYTRLITNLKNNPDASREQIQLLLKQNEMSLLFYEQNFTVSKDTTEIPVSIRNSVANMPTDTVLLGSRMFDYSIFASTFLQRGIYDEIYDEIEKKDIDSLYEMVPVLADKKIKEKKYPKSIEDFLRAKNIHYHLGMEGLSPKLETLCKSFQKETRKQEYRDVLQHDMDKWLALAPGKPAPDFTGVTPQGKPISLSDLKGKIVYIDVWATWCGPCVDEFPSSKKIHRSFAGDDRIAFLYVSVDRDTLAWKKMVAAGKVPEGIHINTNSDDPKSVWTLYHIWGIPRYILVDAQGKMVAANAVRPSSGDLEAQLRELLQTGRLASNGG